MRRAAAQGKSSSFTDFSFAIILVSMPVSVWYRPKSQQLPTYALASTPPGMPGTHPPIFSVGGDVNGNIPPLLLRTFGYSRPILVALRSLSLKPVPFGYKTPPIRFSQAGGQSAHKARPPNLELTLTPLHVWGAHLGQFANTIG